MMNYKTNNLDVDEFLRALCEKKLETLQKFFQEHQEVSADIEFQLEGASNSGKQYKIEVNLTIDGQLYRAEATEESFEQAIDEVRNELDKELRRDKRKRTSLMKRGGRALKNLLRFGK